MGLFAALFGKRPPRAEATLVPLVKPRANPSAVIVLRRGMLVPDEAYVLAVAAVGWDSGSPPETLPRRGLSQPVWWKSSETARSGVSDAVAALAHSLGVDDPEVAHRETNGPDGAPVMLIELRPSAR